MERSSLSVCNVVALLQLPPALTRSLDKLLLSYPEPHFPCSFSPQPTPSSSGRRSSLAPWPPGPAAPTSHPVVCSGESEELQGPLGTLLISDTPEVQGSRCFFDELIALSGTPGSAQGSSTSTTAGALRATSGPGSGRGNPSGRGNSPAQPHEDRLAPPLTLSISPNQGLSEGCVQS